MTQKHDSAGKWDREEAEGIVGMFCFFFVCVFLYLLVSLFPASQAGSVVVPEPQEVIIRYQPLDGVSDQVNVDGLPLHSKPEEDSLSQATGQGWTVKPFYHGEQKM